MGLRRHHRTLRPIRQPRNERHRHKDFQGEARTRSTRRAKPEVLAGGFIRLTRQTSLRASRFPRQGAFLFSHQKKV
eukprot:3585110-Rhodomonas_salina.1